MKWFPIVILAAAFISGCSSQGETAQSVTVDDQHPVQMIAHFKADGIPYLEISLFSDGSFVRLSGMPWQLERKNGSFASDTTEFKRKIAEAFTGNLEVVATYPAAIGGSNHKTIIFRGETQLVIDQHKHLPVPSDPYGKWEDSRNSTPAAAWIIDAIDRVKAVD